MPYAGVTRVVNAAILLGAFVGGTLEYALLQIGYHLLLVPVIVAYLLSFVALAVRRGLPVTRGASAPVAASGKYLELGV
jgi:hypothetical protein